MGFWEKADRYADRGYEMLQNAGEKLQEAAEKKEREALRNLKHQLRTVSDSALYYNLEKFENNGKYEAADLVRDEMRRRGLD